MKPSNIQNALSVYSIQIDTANFFVTRGVATSESFRIDQELFRTSFYMLGVCTGGKVEIEINFKRYDVTAGLFMSVPPHVTVRFISKSEDFMVRMVLFDKSFLLKHTDNTELVDTIGFYDSRGVAEEHLSNDQVDLLIPLFDLIRRKAQAHDPYRDDIVRHLIFTLLYQCAGFYPHTGKDEIVVSSRAKEIKNQFIALVNRHCKTQRKLGFYADKLFITSKHLTETIKQETGMTAGEIIDQTFMLEATILLNDKTKNIQSISQSLNFTNQTVFSKFFKRHSGHTPSEWRNRH